MRNQGDCPHRGELVFAAGQLHYVSLRGNKLCPKCAIEHGITRAQAIDEAYRIVELKGAFLSVDEFAAVRTGVTVGCHSLEEYRLVIASHGVTPQWVDSQSPGSPGATR